MATFYVDFTNGNDSNNGLGPDASHASNKPFKTIAKLVGTTGMSSGDTAYLAPGVFREAFVSFDLTNPGAETRILGDPENRQGFKTPAGVRVAPGEVRITAYTNGDRSAPGSGPVLFPNTRDNITLENVTIVAGAGNRCIVATPTSSNWTLRNCVFIGSGSDNQGLIRFDADFGVALNLTIDRCIIYQFGATGIQILHTSGTGSDYNLNVNITNCIIFAVSSYCVMVTRGGADANVGGGVHVRNNFMACRDANFSTANGASSTVFPCTAYNNIAHASAACFEANSTGELIEDYNFLGSLTQRTNVNSGVNSRSAYQMSYNCEIGQSFLWGLVPKPAFSPTPDSPFLNYGNYTGSPLTVDMNNRPRPSGPGLVWSGTGKAIGPYEYHDFAKREVNPVHSGTFAFRITGPGDQEIHVPVVSGQSTVIAIRARYNSFHGSTDKPQVSILEHSGCNIPFQRLAMTEAVDTWETITFTGFTPNDYTWVTLRCESRSSTGSGIAYFDSLTVT